MAKVIATVDEDVKNEAAELYESMGMSLSTAINVFLRQSVNERGMPLPVFRRRVSEAQASFGAPVPPLGFGSADPSLGLG